MHTLLTDAELSGLVIALSWVLKIFFKPSKAEIEAILKLSIFLITGLLNFMKRWGRDHQIEINHIKNNLLALSIKLRSSREIKG